MGDDEQREPNHPASDTSDSVDRVRVGDAERTATAEELGRQYAAGRLTSEEFEERTAATWQAKTRADLKALTFDLPGGSLDGHLTAAATPREDVPATRTNANADAATGGEPTAHGAEPAPAPTQDDSQLWWQIARYASIFIALIIFFLLRELDVEIAWVVFLIIPLVWMTSGAGLAQDQQRKERLENRRSRKDGND